MIAFNIWVGLRFDPGNPESTKLYTELRKRMPPEVDKALHKPQMFRGVATVDDLRLRFFLKDGWGFGFGAPLIHHASNSGRPLEIDTTLLVNGLYWRERVKKIFDSWSLDAEPKVYLMEDFDK